MQYFEHAVMLAPHVCTASARVRFDIRSARTAVMFALPVLVYALTSAQL
jgi:hypothetical protein